MFEKRRTTLQQPETARSFVTIPKDFIKKLRWIKGQELYIELKGNKIIITKRICKENNIKPVRSRGQNFLINENVYNEIIESADLKKDNIVLEVGPGLGFLTKKLSEKVKKVIAVELDDKLAETLHCNVCTLQRNISIINKNILDINPKELGLKNNNYKIVANLPYNITSVFLRKFLSSENKLDLMVLMLQKEVAERITAKPGKMSLLAVSVQFYAKAEIVK